MELLESEFQRFDANAAKELQKVEEKITKQNADYQKGMLEIRQQLDMHAQPLNAEQEEDGEEEDTDMVRTHFKADKDLESLTETQAEAVLKSVAALMAKKNQKKVDKRARKNAEAVAAAEAHQAYDAR